MGTVGIVLELEETVRSKGCVEHLRSFADEDGAS
jgi:hypothetical protein